MKKQKDAKMQKNTCDKTRKIKLLILLIQLFSFKAHKMQYSCECFIFLVASKKGCLNLVNSQKEEK